MPVFASLLHRLFICTKPVDFPVLRISHSCLRHGSNVWRPCKDDHLVVGGRGQVFIDLPSNEGPNSARAQAQVDDRSAALPAPGRLVIVALDDELSSIDQTFHRSTVPPFQHLQSTGSPASRPPTKPLVDPLRGGSAGLVPLQP